VHHETIDMVESKPAARGSVLKRFLPLIAIACGLAFGYAMGWHQYLSLSFLAESRETLLGFVENNYFLSTSGFLVIYTLAVAFSFPAASVLTIFGGFLFGWLVGGVLVAFAATAGATAIFLAARSAFGDVLRKKVGGRVKRLADGFEKDAFSYLFVLRLAPIFPFFVMNIAPALFNVPLRTYVAATFLGIIPGTFAYAYLGQGIDSVLVAARQAGTDVSVGDLVTPQITLAFFALAVVAAIPLIVKRIRGAR
jgi:uncharacterized membrane protein YdjX (TVP38/TMEM64 family)